MKTGESWDLKHVSDNELLRGLHSIRAAERGAIAQVVAHLAEVEERRLHLRAGSPSMFDYCLRRLGMSESEAFRRVTAARLAQRYPIILEMLAEGDIHLCALGTLRDYLSKENHRELLNEASRKTRKQVEELVAKRFPRADVPSTIRKLPPPRQITTEVMQPVPERETPPIAPDVAAPTPASPPPLPHPLSPAPRPRTIVEPLREDRYRLQLNASAELKRKLELARDLMSHANPGGDLTVAIERALDLLIDKLQRERFSQTRRKRANTAADPHKRRVPSAVRRQVVERDGLQCTYVSADGERCPSRAFLQFHHEQAWALGGKTTTGNSRILCGAHNRLLAEQDFGKELMADKIAAARTKRERPPESR